MVAADEERAASVHDVCSRTRHRSRLVRCRTLLGRSFCEMTVLGGDRYSDGMTTRLEGGSSTTYSSLSITKSTSPECRIDTELDAQLRQLSAARPSSSSQAMLPTILTPRCSSVVNQVVGESVQPVYNVRYMLTQLYVRRW
jgi:hypothetical protein